MSIVSFDITSQFSSIDPELMKVSQQPDIQGLTPDNQFKVLTDGNLPSLCWSLTTIKN